MQCYAPKQLWVVWNKHYWKYFYPSFYQDHSYALPNSPTRLKARLSEALARVESLEREKQNAKETERAKKTVKSLLEDLKEKNLVWVCEWVSEWVSEWVREINSNKQNQTCFFIKI